MKLTNIGTGSVGCHITGLPFTANATPGAAYGVDLTNATSLTNIIGPNQAYFDFYKYDGSNPLVSGHSYAGSIIYQGTF